MAQEPIKVDFSGKGKKDAPQPIVIPPERATLRIILSIVGSVLTALIGYYLLLPPLNFRAKEFYYYIALVIGSFIVLLALLSGALSRPEYMPFVKKVSRIPFFALLAVAVFFALAMAFSSPFFQAKKYSQLLSVRRDAKFENDIEQPDFSSIPKIDETASKKLAGRALSDLANSSVGGLSQFVISDTTTQINYQKRPVRAVTLSYANIIKWLTNTSQGIPGYVIVNMADETYKFNPVEGRIKYSDAEHFGRLLKRWLRFKYPTVMFGEANFEIDDDANPFWIVPVMTKKIGLFGGEDVTGIVMVNAVSGDCIRYSIEEIRKNKDLEWIDRVYGASLLNLQYNYYGKYQGGFWNSVLGQKEVEVTTQGYSYLALNDDVYMYSGITSITGDQSIIGFILVNQRTKEAVRYSVTGGTEQAAEEYAKGLVQQYKYGTTFPLLINYGGQPTYFLSLIDADYNRQGYAMVNVNKFNKVYVWNTTIQGVIADYNKALKDNDISVTAKPPAAPEPGDTPPPDDGGERTVTGAITDLRAAVIDGNTTFFMKISGQDLYFSIAVKNQPSVVLFSTGQTVAVTYLPAEGAILPATQIVPYQPPASAETGVQAQAPIAD
ncbi:MAG: CvpA family protein [Oscillospiraceae bacterium]|jgi:hypothetical protein|nr:CvpA family protein [Oscillospiraceae bacterium]